MLCMRKLLRSVIQQGRKSYLKCVWIKRINNAIQANSKKSETKLVEILYFLPWNLRQSLAFTESNKIFKGASLSSVTYCLNQFIWTSRKTNTSFQLPQNWCHCRPTSPSICRRMIHQQNFLCFQLTNPSFVTSLEHLLFPGSSHTNFPRLLWMGQNHHHVLPHLLVLPFPSARSHSSYFGNILLTLLPITFSGCLLLYPLLVISLRCLSNHPLSFTF